MLLATVGDDAVKVFEAFTYIEGESAERFDDVIRKFKEYCTPVRNVVYERFLFWQDAQSAGESIDQYMYVTSQRHLRSIARRALKTMKNTQRARRSLKRHST